MMNDKSRPLLLHDQLGTERTSCLNYVLNCLQCLVFINDGVIEEYIDGNNDQWRWMERINLALGRFVGDEAYGCVTFKGVF